MAYGPIVNVDITISDVQVSVAGFGTPLFITTHRTHKERVQAYGSAAEVGNVYGTDSAAYFAAVNVFSQSPKVTNFKVGRRDGELRLVPTDVLISDVFSFDITNNSGVTFTATYTASSGDDATDVVTALAASINGDSDMAEDVLAVPSGSQLILQTKLGTGDVWQDSYFTVGNYSAKWSGNDIWYGNESGAQVYAEILAEDNDFYFVAADDNSTSFVTGGTGLAAAVQTTDKMYFVSDSDIDNIASITEPDNSLFGTLAAANYSNTVTLFSQEAGDSSVANDHAGSTSFPEMAYIGANAVYPAGSVSWSNIVLSGIPASTNPSTGLRLTSTQKNNLDLRNSNYLEYDAGNTYTRYGQTSSNDWIDTIRGVHWQTADMHSNLKALLLGQKGGKVTYDGNGIARVREVIASSLQRGINRNFLSSYKITMPRLADISSVTKLSRVLENVSFEANVAGAIHEITVQGTVSEG